MRGVVTILAGSLATVTLAASHYLFAGNLNAPAAIHLLEFNDEVGTLEKIKTFPADSPHNWITLDHARRNIYGTSLKASRLASYDVSTPTELKPGKSMTQIGACSGKNPNYVDAMKTEPYYVVSVTWPSPDACGAAYSVHANGTINGFEDTWSYAHESGAHGVAFGRRDAQPILYTADLNGDSVWAHAINTTNGQVKELGRLKMAKTGVHPRHVAAHPNGKYLFLVMEAENTIHQVDLDAKTGVPTKDSKNFSVIPDGHTASSYAAASLALSSSGRYLWTIARGARGTKNNSQISCFLLGEDGAVIKRLFVTSTTTVGSGSNAVTPAFWNEEYVVVSESPGGHVQVFKLAGKSKGDQGMEFTGAELVASSTVDDGGCCANAVWYS